MYFASMSAAVPFKTKTKFTSCVHLTFTFPLVPYVFVHSIKEGVNDVLYLI